jgi:hypothetical protein
MGTLSGRAPSNQPLGHRAHCNPLDFNAGEGARDNLGEAQAQEPLGLGTVGRARGLTVRLAAPVVLPLPVLAPPLPLTPG